jgi:acetolactate synthase I/III small subunit
MTNDKFMKHTISVILEDRFGDLQRLIGLFSAKCLEIESLSVSQTLDGKLSCATIVTGGDDRAIEQVVKLLNRQVRVLSAADVTNLDCIEREMAFIKVKTETGDERQTALNLASLFNAKVVDASDDSFIIEAIGDSSTVRGLINSLKPFGIQEVVRTGTVAIERLNEATEKAASNF